MKKKWTLKDMKDQHGKVVIVTGANSGLGYEISKAFAIKGAQVILACRSVKKGQKALEKIRNKTRSNLLKVLRLDLAKLDLIKSFVKKFNENYNRLDVLVNNAGVMFLPYGKTEDGFERHFGINHLGHFALTGLLLEKLLETPDSRVVTMSSLLHKGGKIKFSDLQSDEKYNKYAAYSQSKLANLLFSYELENKFEQAGIDVKSIAAHPGYSATNLQIRGPEMEGAKFRVQIMKIGNKLFGQSAEKGALPILYAATEEDVKSGEYFGPSGIFEYRGYPAKVESNGKSHDEKTAKKLWNISEKLTGISYDDKLN